MGLIDLLIGILIFTHYVDIMQKNEKMNNI